MIVEVRALVMRLPGEILMFVHAKYELPTLLARPFCIHT